MRQFSVDATLVIVTNSVFDSFDQAGILFFAYDAAKLSPVVLYETHSLDYYIIDFPFSLPFYHFVIHWDFCIFQMYESVYNSLIVSYDLLLVQDI